MGFKILATGSYLPEKLMTNQDFEKIIDTSDEWIYTRTGIRRRHYVEDGMDNAQMCERAALSALNSVGLTPQDIGCIIVATCTGEMAVPGTAGQLQRAFGIEDCMAFDVSAACSGYIYALKASLGFITDTKKPVLVCGTETLSRFMNHKDRASCILFADGAGCTLIEPGDNLLYFRVYSKPDYNHTIEINGMNTYNNGVLVPSLVSLKGKEVYAFATREIERVLKDALLATGLSSSDIDWFVMSQANLRIIKAAADRLGVPMEKCFVNIDDVANTSSASIPIALDQMNRQGLLKPGNKIAIVGFGGGLTSGCAIYRW